MVMLDDVCLACGRIRRWAVDHRTCGAVTPAYLTAEHGYYGCDTGCCGMAFVAYDAGGHEVARSHWEFQHADSREVIEEWLRCWAAEWGWRDVPLRVSDREAAVMTTCSLPPTVSVSARPASTPPRGPPASSR